MRAPHLVGTGLTALTLLALAACTTTPGDGGAAGGADGSEGSVAGGSTAECLQGTWELDAQDNVDQLQAFFAENGLPVVSSEYAGGITLDVDGSAMIFDADITYTISAELDGGIQMQVVQSHVGTSEGGWTEDGSEIAFVDWTNGITITNTILVDGAESTTPFELPADTGSGVAMETGCEGNRLSTHPVESPFTAHWDRLTP